ncbi:MAG: TetR/AcrR family transcriptional regulator C-terminal domain-containing protein, partial [Candidatus Saccharibacteria bacterium]|nr:TetR/AcrR family transcriptional regulator C-terminal domain-containing protein [Pseudorhodobacter sp.]
RAALMSHRDGARVHAGSRANRGQFEQQMAVLLRGGLPMPLAVQLMVSVGRFVVGWVLEEQAESALPIGPVVPPEGLAGQAIRLFFETGDKAAFKTGLRMMFAGAEAMARAP